MAIAIFGASRAFGQASDPDLRPTRGPFITGGMRAGTGDATDTELNPAALALMPASDAEIVGAAAGQGGTIPRRGAGLYLAAPFWSSALGFGLTRVSGTSDAPIDSHTTLRLAYALNQVLDVIQREKQRPSWTIGGTPDKPEWGIDSAYIHVAGIKIPTMALALLGNLLPQGNFDESMRARQLQDMRDDLLHAAARAESFQQFRRYVRELRERKQAERDAEQRRRAQDTVKAVP